MVSPSGGDPSCLICNPALTKTGHQITHDETGRWQPRRSRTFASTAARLR